MTTLCGIINIYVLEREIMKRIGLGVIAAIALVVGGASTAQAYPPDPGPDLEVSTTTPVAGSSIIVTLQPCIPGEDAVFTLEEATETTTADSEGVASTSIVVPDTPGNYTLVGVCGETVDSIEITVVGATDPTPETTTAPPTTAAPTAGLPAAGAGGLGSTVPMALGLVLFGAMILGVAQLRRRDSAA
jgi:hypothetical protein